MTNKLYPWQQKLLDEIKCNKDKQILIMPRCLGKKFLTKKAIADRIKEEIKQKRKNNE